MKQTIALKQANPVMWGCVFGLIVAVIATITTFVAPNEHIPSGVFGVSCAAYAWGWISATLKNWYGRRIG